MTDYAGSCLAACAFFTDTGQVKIMFFMMAITQGQKKFDFVQTVICRCCGAYGRFEVFMTFTVLSLFFIPVLRWNRQYFVRMTCCGTIYRLNPEVGKRIARQENVEICEEDLTLVGNRHRENGRCPGCGASVSEQFSYCPYCGMRF